MKKLLTIAMIAIVSSIYTFGQSGDVEKSLKSIEGQWKVDQDQNVTYQIIITDSTLKKDEICNRVMNHFIYDNGTGKGAVQTQNKETGIVETRGLWNDVHRGYWIVSTKVSTHILVRVEVKDFRARVTLSLTEYDIISQSGAVTMKVSSTFPANPNGGLKTQMGKAFYNSHLKVMETFNAITKAIREGNIPQRVDFNKKDW